MNKTAGNSTKLAFGEENTYTTTNSFVKFRKFFKVWNYSRKREVSRLGFTSPSLK